MSELERLHEENRELRKIIEELTKYQGKDDNGNFTISVEIPAANFHINALGSYINGSQSFEDIIMKELRGKIKSEKEYVMNMQLDICLIDPEKKFVKSTGGIA